MTKVVESNDIYKNKSLEDLPSEIWKDVVNFEGLYKISSLGRLKSVQRKVSTSNGKLYNISERILAQSTEGGGYLKAGLSTIDKKSVYIKIHRLMAIAFLPNPENKEQSTIKTESKQTTV